MDHRHYVIPLFEEAENFSRVQVIGKVSSFQDDSSSTEESSSSSREESSSSSLPISFIS